MQDDLFEVRIYIMNSNVMIGPIKRIRKKAMFNKYVFEQPDYIEFDDINKIIVTKHTKEGCYRIWNIEDDDPFLVIKDPFVYDIRICKDHLALIGIWENGKIGRASCRERVKDSV